MQLVKRYGLYRSDKICFVDVNSIIPNSAQPRKRFDHDELRELANSISRYGILQPLTVMSRNRGYELVAGERRLRAARMVGMTEVPCILLNVDTEDASLIALVENLQRKDLDYIEEASTLANLIRTFDMSQEEIARRVGKSQSAVANKLRLLKLPKDVLETLRQQRLSERHARALLRLGTNEDRRDVLQYVISKRLNVAKTEEYIDKILSKNEIIEAEKAVEAVSVQAHDVLARVRNRPQFVIKDVRLFLNTVVRATEMIKQSGIKVEYGKDETETDILVTIRIPKG